MLRSRFLPVLWSFLFIPAISFADDPKTPQEKLEAQQKQIDEKLTQLLNEIASLKGKVELIQKNSALRSDVTDMTFLLGDLRDEINKLRGEMRTSQKPASDFNKMPETGKIETRRVPSGTFRIINDYTDTAIVAVNGVDHVLNPGAVANISVPAGAFTYQVMGFNTAPKTMTVGVDKVTEIRIFRR